MKAKSKRDECSFCGGRLEERSVRYQWAQGDKLALIEGVLANVCQRCGHRWFPATSARMLEDAFSGEREPTGKIEVPIYSFSE